jgi:hypothetical protein
VNVIPLTYFFKEQEVKNRIYLLALGLSLSVLHTANGQSLTASTSYDAESFAGVAKVSLCLFDAVDDHVIVIRAKTEPLDGNLLSLIVVVEHKYAGMTVEEILKKKKGSIKQAPLPEGSPSWDDIKDEKWEDIEKKAKAGETGYKTFKKLLTDKRFDK